MKWISGLKPRFENQVQTWKWKTWKWEAEFQVSKTRIPGFQNSGPNPTWYLIYQVSKTGGLNLKKDRLNLKKDRLKPGKGHFLVYFKKSITTRDETQKLISSLVF